LPQVLALSSRALPLVEELLVAETRRKLLSKLQSALLKAATLVESDAVSATPTQQ